MFIPFYNIIVIIYMNSTYTFSYKKINFNSFVYNPSTKHNSYPILYLFFFKVASFTLLNVTTFAVMMMMNPPIMIVMIVTRLEEMTKLNISRYQIKT